MVTALYRRYRPDTFADLIGQEQVTAPLSTALRTNRVNHAYLFSGPRGCGKTTSARILARCLNCEQGPTDTPCGECASCRELATGGSGSLDVIEIDAASHGGVDDARDLRERAVFAPARDRYKVFIIDEAHMVTAAGFNALLKLVEEPPEHVKFIFATTEPEKVIGTIRSRTHHYPFRLVPPATMLPFLEKILSAEDVSAEPGVMPLAVRAGGGSVRDTLSVVDQLIAGSEDGTISYTRTIGLLGYTPGDLLAEVIDAIGRQQAEQLFLSVDKVIQTGQDPKRFAEDVLERLRDLIVVQAAPDQAQAILRGTSQDELDILQRQAREFGTAELSRAADIVNHTLNTMAGTTSPRMQLELMCARLLVPAADADELGALSRIDRLERRIGVQNASTAPRSQDGAPAQSQPSPATAAPQSASAQPASVQPASVQPAPDAASPAAQSVVPETQTVTESPTVAAASTAAVSETPAVTAQTPTPASISEGTESTTTETAAHAAALTLDQIRAGWDQVLAHLEGTNRRAWIVAINAKPVAFREDILTLSFASAKDAEHFRGSRSGGNPAADGVRDALQQIFGIRMRFIAHSGSTRPAPQVSGSPVPRDSSATHEGSATRGDQAQRNADDARTAQSGQSDSPSQRPQPTANGAQRDSAQPSSAQPDRPEQTNAAQPPTQPPTAAKQAEPWPEELPPEPPEDYDDAGAPPYEGPATNASAPGAASPSASEATAPSEAKRTAANGPVTPHHRAQYGEAVIRQVLHAKPIDEK